MPLLGVSQSDEKLTETLTDDWELTMVKEFSQKYEPEEREGDNFEFKEDGTFKGNYEGKPNKGEWKVQRQQWLMLYPENRDQFKLKLIETGKDKIILEYQDPESLVRTKLIYEPS
jgi:hypothetical protein